jgi:DNA-binding SARP family transcriptional activator
MTYLLRTLGSTALYQHTDAGERHVPMPAKLLALLIFLARGGPGRFLRRDLLLALLWPDLDDSHGRASLRQALTGLRKQLGPDALITGGEDEVGLAPGAVTCDATEFERACEATAFTAASSLYQGGFLVGFHAAGLAPEFAQWVDEERVRLHRMAVAAAWGESDDAERAGRGAEAVRLARRAVELAPEDEPGVSRLIGLLDKQGDRSGALSVYDRLARRLADEYSVEPSPETRALVEAVRARAGARWEPTPAGGSREPVAAGGEAANSGMEAPIVEEPSLRRRLLIAGVIGAALMLAFVAVSAWVRRPALPAGELAAVMPFRVSAADSGLAWLHEGMVELLSIRLTGEGGMRVAEPGRVLTALRRQVPAGRADVPEDVVWDVATEIGAGRVIQGSVSGTSGIVALSAWVLAPRGRVVARASVEGSPDSLLALVDRLAAQLLGLGAGIEASRLASFTSTSLPAVRAFLAGRTAFRAGRKEEARRRFLEAVELDSNFTLAALDLYRTMIWVSSKPERDIVIRRAIAGRDRLSPADRAWLDVEAHSFTNAPEEFARYNVLVAAYPDRPETWYGLGDQYYHNGRLAGIDSSLERAEAAFRRGWQLDSAANGAAAMSPMPPLVAEPMEHMVQLAHIRGDSAEVRRLVGLVLAADSSSDLARGMRWHLASMQGDSARRAYWDGIGNATSTSMMYIIQFIAATGLGAEDYPHASAETLRRLPHDSPEHAPATSRVIELNNGRPSAAATAIEATERRRRLRLGVLAALFWDGDSAAAGEAVRELTRYADGPGESPEEIRTQAQEVCALGQWRMARGDLHAGEAASRRLRDAKLPQLRGTDSVSFHQTAELCAALLDAWRVSLQRPGPAARVAIAVADSLARTNIFQVCFCTPEGVQNANLLLAALWERSGDLASALGALRRRGGLFGIQPVYHSSFLREEGRLAALTGDTAGAIRAYRHYLALRYDPEPSARPEVERVRRELAALVGR